MIASVAVLAALALLGRDVVAFWARYQAARDLDAWAISAALQCLDRSDQWDPDHHAALLLRARCYRHLGQWEQRDATLERAPRHGVSAADLENETTLGQIQRGELAEGAESRLGQLTAAGLSPHDIASAYIEGRMARQDNERAEVLLRAWTADFPDEPHTHYVRGQLLARGGDQTRARQEFEQTLSLQPRHELAQIALAQLDDEAKAYDQALTRLIPLAENNPDNQNVLIALSRVLRKTGRAAQARQVLAPFLELSSPPAAIAAEAGQVEQELGNYEAAERWFDRCSAQEMVNHTTLSAAAMSAAMLGKTVQAERAYQWIFDEVSAVTVMHDLRSRMQADPGNQEAAAEFQQLIARLRLKSAEENPWQTAADTRPTGRSSDAGPALYEQHCECCHGAEGRGDGRAARHLYPRPRDLLREKMRLVSTRNGVPTDSDIKNVIRSGIPGTAMVPLPDLREDELDLLVGVVRTMQRAGIREQYEAELRAYGEEVDPEDVREVVAIQSTPRDVVTVPPLSARTDESLLLGQQLYVSQTCDSCHGADGTGDVEMPLFDDLGRPAFPRDLVHEPFKNGNSPEPVYLRILLGMPGSPHPANINLSHDDCSALTHYCQSLGKTPKAELTNYQRAMRDTSRPALEWGQTTP